MTSCTSMLRNLATTSKHDGKSLRIKVFGMGRRALRRIDPELDLSSHLVALDALPKPLAAAEIFGRTAPLEIEVGSGKGLFLSAAAIGDPTCDYLGIEIMGKYARYAA